MAKAFPRARPGDVPTRGESDELLDDPPDLPRGGSMEGYSRGGWARKVVFGSLIGGVIVTGFVVHWYIGKLQADRNRVVPQYVIDPEDARDSSKVLYWDEGAARLGLYRDGVQAIVLPDRVLTLAPGIDHAQVSLVVRDGETIKIKVLVGQIKTRKRDPSSE